MCHNILTGGGTPVDIPGLGAGEIAIIVGTSPIWIPIGLAALAVFIPVGVGFHIVASIKNALERKEYRKNKATFMKRWAHMLLEELHKEENISRLIEGVCMESMTERINFLFTNFLPRIIEADKAQLHEILSDKRTADQIVQQFLSEKEEMKDIIKSLYLFDLKYLADDVVDITKILRYKQVGGGSFSDVYRASWRQTDDNEKDVALKILKGHDLYLQLSEIDSSRYIKIWWLIYAK